MRNLAAEDWLRTIDSHADNAGDGLWLEELVCDLGNRIPEWDFKEVFRWDEWPDRDHYFPGSSPADVGIDNVGIRPDGSLVAIQCKARSGGTDLTLNDVSPFKMSTGDDKWSELWVITNVQLTRGAREANLRSESKPLKLVDFVEPVRALVHQESAGNNEDSKLTSMQNEVVNKVLKGLKNHAKKGRSEWNKGEARGHIVMPCGTGKSRVAYRVMKSIVESGELAVVLVPSIALVSQIKREFQTLARRDGVQMRALAICSDSTAGRTSKGRLKSEDTISLSSDPTIDTSYVHSYEIVGDTATNEDQVVNWLQKHKTESSNSILAMFSTYQSAHNTASGLRNLNIKVKLMICDEAHRTAGIKKIPKDGERLRNFTLCHDKNKFPATYRLYQTATPRIYTTKPNQTQNLLYEDDSTWDIRSMNDPATFGPELYRLSYVEAVERELLSDYRIIAWGINESDEIHEIAKKLNINSKASDDKSSLWDSNKAMRALTLAAFLAGCVKSVNVRSVIAFCNRIKLSSELALAVESKPIQEWLTGYFERLGIEQSPADFNVEHVDASFHSAKRNDALHKLGTATQKNPFCISNVGIFGEGTDSPGLSAVAFLNPRKSPVDVIQAVGRAMRKSPDKKCGYILVPVVIPQDRDPENFLRNSNPEHGWEELGQILQALRAHDGRIEDRLESLMEFYAPPPPVESAKHVIVVKELHRQTKVYELDTKTPTVEQVLAPKSTDDNSRVENRLQRDKGKVREIKDVSKLNPLCPPRSISAVIVDKNRELLIKDLTYANRKQKDKQNLNETWNPVESIEVVKEFIRKDKRRKKTQMRRIPPRRRRVTDKQLELGQKLLHLEGDTLAETGIHLNLLEKSGIQSGSRRDINLLRGTVRTVAEYLRTEDLENTLALRLGMENVERSSQGVADACAVTAVIWVNAAIMHARLAKNNTKTLSKIRPIEDAISEVTPARGLIESWQKILIHDYVPIFEVALELLHDVAFKNLECVSDALRQLAKDASDIADHYANLGMDHAGELFNEVMGNQRSDGAFFTRPLAATMLAELCLHASGETNWLDDKLWDKRRCFDPACGSGTILVAMMNAIKRRIQLAGGSINMVRRFHHRAVEHLMIGADINHVALQLAGCQLTLGDVSTSYDKMNLHSMNYGADNADSVQQNVKTGTVELLLDDRIVPRPNTLKNLHLKETNLQISMGSNVEFSSLGDDLYSTPPYFNLMNPPYTPWRDIGSKFNLEIQKALRKRLSDIWDELAVFEPLLKGKKTTIAMLFELLSMKLVRKSKGVFGLVLPTTALTSEQARETRKIYAIEAHVDYVLTCHQPSNFNMSWNTNINECLIVMSNVKANKDNPTLFINLHRFPQSIEEAHEVIDKAVRGEPFDGSSISWDYELVKKGDWTPAVFADCVLAELAQKAISSSAHLRSDLIRSRMPKQPGGGESDMDSSMARWTIRYLEVMLTSKLTRQEEIGA